MRRISQKWVTFFWQHTSWHCEGLGMRSVLSDNEWTIGFKLCLQNEEKNNHMEWKDVTWNETGQKRDIKRGLICCRRWAAGSKRANYGRKHYFTGPCAQVHQSSHCEWVWASLGWISGPMSLERCSGLPASFMPEPAVCQCWVGGSAPAEIFMETILHI